MSLASLAMAQVMLCFNISVPLLWMQAEPSLQQDELTKMSGDFWNGLRSHMSFYLKVHEAVAGSGES